MGLYKNKFNPVSGSFNLVPTGTIITFKDGVANAVALPVSGNTLNDARITADTGHLYVWDGTSWVDSGDIIDLKWSAIDGKPSSSAANIDDAVSKRHSNSLDHTQGTDLGLDTGGTNAVTAAQAKAGYSHSQVAHAPSDAVSLATVKADTDIDNAIDNTHAPHSDDQVIPTALSALSDDSTHRLVTDAEKGTWNGKQDSLGVTAQDIIDISLNIMLNAFRIAQIGSLTIFAMIKGFMDEYEDESGIDLVNSINQVYDAVDDYYSPLTIPGGIDSYTKLMLHLDNNVTDSEITPKTITNNGVTFSSGIKKFGTHSAQFDGSSSNLNLTDSPDWDFDGDFTIDFWVYPTNLSVYSYLMGSANQNSGSDGFYMFMGNEGYPFLTFAAMWTGSYWTIDIHKYAHDMNLNAWNHIAIVRSGSTISAYTNGVLKGTGSSAVSIVNSNPVYVGKSPFGFPAFPGYIDEIRISKGIARWTSDFSGSLPNIPYSLIGSIYNMTLLSNAQVVDDVPTSARIVLFEEDIDSTTLNTDLKAYISRDNGTTYSQITLEDEGNYIIGARVLSGLVNISSQPSGSNVKYKIETLNNKNLKLHGTGISWK